MNFDCLKKTSLWQALSALGKTMETPQGIFAWSARAKNEAEIDGTIGIAQDDDGFIAHLKMAEEWAGADVMARVQKAKVFGYAPIEGVESLRKKWLAMSLQSAPKLERFASQPVVTNGITHSLAIAGRLFLQAGDTLITADKSWENYEHIFSDVQCIRIRTFPLFHEREKFNKEGILQTCRAVAEQGKKVVLLLNFPHNQTGFMPSAEELSALGGGLSALCRAFPDVPFVWLLDDAYEGYVYDEAGQKTSPLPQLFAALPNLTVAKMDGISKVLLAYGYRIGFLTLFASALGGSPWTDESLKHFRSEVGSKIGGFIRGEISQANHHGQVLADALMDRWDTVLAEKSRVIDMLRKRWEAYQDALAFCSEKFGSEKVHPDPCNGGFFGYVNLAP
ncbi:aminotransferase class I/II-fold pyridoxal phosphate-dependent enzyme, partial [Candidatus Peregrinibacteria bacterium]|nr:aminotransferase class I/II-fold pyridoxal phosphate-dependent enzyme [Candidatus Peregrinibacteria bacterium]